jgi:hypothetical protein
VTVLSGQVICPLLSVLGVDSGQLVGVCTGIPNFVDELVIRVEVPSVGNYTIANGSSTITDGAKRDRLVWPGDMSIALETIG